MPQTPNTEKLDEHLLEVVRAVHGAVKQGVSHSMIQRSSITR
jgi:hypothetical protein